MKTFAILTALIAGTALAVPETALAGWGYSGSQGFTRGFGGTGWGVNRGYNNWNRGSFYGGSNFRRPLRYHDTSHFDYHPPQIIRHRNHFHVTPGHYDFHQTGHFHR